ncbi:MAG: hypothetical protein EBQ97_00210 [Bacteroidetes bacterium]|nr:hypothetical protein [Bacteroidota bacterium]
MNLLSKEVLIGAASLGAGAVAAKVVQKKVLPMIKADISPVVGNLTTLVVGILTPTIVKGSVGTGLGAGMIAVSVAGLVDPYLAKAGITGYDDTYMGDVLMGETGDVLMGATDFSAPSNDFTGAGAGEMDY